MCSMDILRESSLEYVYCLVRDVFPDGIQPLVGRSRYTSAGLDEKRYKPCQEADLVSTFRFRS